MKFGLDEITIDKINGVFEKNINIDEVIIYGSRAKGNFRPGSDIDITLKGENISFDDLFRVTSNLDDINTPYFFDVSIFSKIQSEEFLEHINRIGQTFYKKIESQI